MGEKVDRRGFLGILRRSQATDEPEATEEEPEREPTPREMRIRELAEFSSRLLADFAPDEEERLADGPLLTKAYDQAYMRVTSGHIVYSSVTGASASIRTDDVTAFDTEAPVDAEGHGPLQIGVLRARHPADPPAVTRSYAFRFPAGGALPAAIRTACDIPEPEPAADDEGEGASPPPDAGESE